jgi:hypothetical protein
MLPKKKIESLERKHSMLSHTIEREEARRTIDPTTLRALKREKLLVKDILAGVRDARVAV